MAIEIVADLEVIQPSSPEWHELRKLGIGGSDAGAVCGVSKWRTPYQVWAEKVNPSIPTLEAETEAQSWGKILEAPVREFSRRTSIEVHPFPRMVRNTDHPFMLANVDGLTGPATALTGAYEGKTTRFAENWAIADDGSVSVPLDNTVQGMHYLAVFEQLERIYFACLIGGQQLRIAEVEVNPQLIEDLIAIEAAFWQSVLDREPPEVSAADIETLRNRWQPSAGKRIELSGTHHTNLKVRAKYKKNIRDTEKKIQDIDAEIMAFMGDATEAVFNGQVVVTWNQDKKGRVSNDLLEAGGINLDDYRAAPGRRFLPKEVD